MLFSELTKLKVNNCVFSIMVSDIEGPLSPLRINVLLHRNVHSKARVQQMKAWLVPLIGGMI